MMKRPLIITLIVIGFVAQGATNALAYDSETTHPALTDEIVDFYNALHPGSPLTAEEKEWIISGSKLEDTPPRWVNHFYDPVSKTGWSGAGLGDVPPSVVQALAFIGLTPENALPATDWVNNKIVQDRYANYGGDRTWKTGIQYWIDGNKKEALTTLGDALHLLEDMAVPDHTRDDTHVDVLGEVTGIYGSPYEEYATKWTRTTIESLNIASNLKRENASPPARTSVEDYLAAVADYSNKYFFSKDSINSPKYQLPKIVWEDGNFGYGVDENGKEFPLVKVDVIFGAAANSVEIYSIKKDDADYPILDAYFSRLSRQAVLNGAGVVEFFLKQANQETADAAVNKEFQFQSLNPDLKGLFSLVNTPDVSLYGEFVKAGSAVKSFFVVVADSINGALANLAGLFSGSVINTVDTQPTVGTAGYSPPGLLPKVVLITAPSSGGENVELVYLAEPESGSLEAQSVIAPLATLSEEVFIGGGGGGSPSGASGAVGSASAASDNVAQTTNTTATTTGITEENSTSTLTESTSTTTSTLPVDTWAVIQSVDTDTSHPSWYSDNWYQLGTGFWGTVHAIKVRGYINDPDYFKSSLTLKEFLDSAYSQLNRTFTISGDAPFTATTTEVMIDGLNILLQPNKHYRLDTYQGYQSRSVILMGTTSTGTAIWNEFIYGAGGVSHTYDFYPYLAVIMDKETPLLAPNSPSGLYFNFDSLNSVVNVVWSSSTDPDTTDNLLTYEINYSSSSEFSSDGWRSVGKNLNFSFPVAYPENYLFGVRALDDFGAASIVNATSWSFPPGYFPMPEQLDHSANIGGVGGRQKITMPGAATIDAVYLWGIGGPGGNWCCSQSYLNIYRDNAGALGDLVASSSPFTFGYYPGEVGMEIVYPFPAPVVLEAASYWLAPTQGPPDRTNGTGIFGSAMGTYSGGWWDDGSGDTGQDAYFRLRSVVE